MCTAWCTRFYLFYCSSIQIFPFFPYVLDFTSNCTKIRSAALQGIVLGIGVACHLVYDRHVLSDFLLLFFSDTNEKNSLQSNVTMNPSRARPGGVRISYSLATYMVIADRRVLAAHVYDEAKNSITYSGTWRRSSYQRPSACTFILLECIFLFAGIYFYKKTLLKSIST
jgi:hypothetical protein